MDWIKKRYDQFAAALSAIALIAVAVMIFLNTTAFQERFSAVMTTPSRNDQIPAVDTAVIDEARRQLEQPAIWKPRAPETEANGGRLFSATHYIVGPEGRPIKIKEASTWVHSQTQQPIPNEWVLNHNFDALNPAGAQMDPDGDGFWNEDEWLHQTDPNQKANHPPNHTLLFLRKYVRVPFRFTLHAYNGDVRTPEQLDFQIETLDLSERTRFLRLGEDIKPTPFKLLKFEFKEAENKNTGEKDDVSELTLINKDTQDTVVLTKNKETSSTNEFAKFDYYLVVEGGADRKKPMEFTVPKGKEFVLKPEIDKRYKLLDVKATEAVIQLPDDQKFTVPTYPGGSPK